MRLLAIIALSLALCACGSPVSRYTPTPSLVQKAATARSVAESANEYAEEVQSASDVAIVETQQAREAVEWELRVTSETIAIEQARALASQSAISASIAISEELSLSKTRIETERQISGHKIASAEAQAKEDRRWADFWDGALNMVLVIIGGLLACLSYVAITQFRAWLVAHVALKQAEARRARVEWRQVEYKGEIVEIGWAFPDGGGVPYAMLPEAREEAPKEPHDDTRRVEAWRQAVLRFTQFAGDGSYSFERLRKMGIVNRRGWDCLTEYMIRGKYLVSGGEASKTRWSGEWNCKRFHDAAWAGELAPFPIDDDYVPVVNSPVAQFTE